jgi:uncharacterized protein YigE (DUF2233 family)
MRHHPAIRNAAAFCNLAALLFLFQLCASPIGALPGAAGERSGTASGKYAAACYPTTFENSRLTVCTLNTRLYDIKLASTDRWGGPLRSFDRLKAELGSSSHRVRFAMNAGMFDPQGTPIGLFVENDIQRTPLNTHDGTGNFYLKPNGVFWAEGNGALGIETTENFAARHATPKWATQSGPMLVIDGQINPQVSADGPSKYIRNGVGLRDDHTALFVISEDEVSFGRLARFFRDRLACRNALYFDGAVSSLWVPSSGRQDSSYALGPMIVVLNR